MESNSKNTLDLESILGVTTNNEGLEALIYLPKLLAAIIAVLEKGKGRSSEQAASILINVSAEEKGAEALLNLDNIEDFAPFSTVHRLFSVILNGEDNLSDLCCKILSNLTHHEYLAEKVIDSFLKSNFSFDMIAGMFTKSNTDSAKLSHLGLVLSNLSQTPRARKLILDEEKCVIQRLLPYTEYKESLVCRKGIVGMLRNCCFESYYHKWLLSEDVDVLPYLLLPLAGNTEFGEEENDKLPIELQYLPEDKERESDVEIRCMLLESIILLCSKRENREYVRSKNAYIILRELHKWEQDKKALLVCENLVNILIRTEDEIGEDDLKELVVPENLQEQFKKIEQELLQGS